MVRSSRKALDAIVAFEVSGEEYYNKRLRKPTWPGLQSGPTIGIGYDLGQTSEEAIRADWSGELPPYELSLAVNSSGCTGAYGKQRALYLRDKLDVPWDVACRVFQLKTIPRWEAVVRMNLKNTELLPPDSFGALVSLTFNRGPSFASPGPRYLEMRNIAEAMAQYRFAAIPQEIRKMSRLWPNHRGLRVRRAAEAELFEQGFKESVPATPVA